VYVSVYDEQALTDNKLAALIDERRTAPRDIYDLELLLARGVCPSAQAIERAGGYAALMPRVSEKLDLMGWALFRDQVLPALPREIQANIDEGEYLATKIRLLESLERCLSKHPRRRGVTMRSPHWTTRLELALSEPTALRVLDKGSIVRLARDISEPTVERWIQEAISAGRLQRVVRGLYLNRLVRPPAQLCEAAVWLRPGAVISLQTVLGDSGVWNNRGECFLSIASSLWRKNSVGQQPAK
jgi:hypothetical protein